MSTVKVNSAQIGQSVTATNNFTWYQPSSPDGTVRLGNGNAGSVTDLVTLTSAGNLGIGTSSPTARLQIGDATVSTANVLVFGKSVASTESNLPYIYCGSSDGAGNDLYILGRSTSSKIIFGSGASGTERMRLDSSGNLGLGVTPSGWASLGSAALQVGNAALYASGANGYVSANAYYDGAYKYISAGYSSRLVLESGTFKVYTAGSGSAGGTISFTQAMTLDASGNLLVNCTSASLTSGGVSITKYTNGNYIDVGHATGAGTADGYVRFFYGSTQIGQIAQNGTSNVQYLTSSDQRLKTNVAPAGSAIQSILDFPVDQFDWISTGEHQDFGAVAQKAINVIPEMVSVPEDPEAMWGIDWSKAVPRLIRTIQEMHTEIQELKAKVSA